MISGAFVILQARMASTRLPGKAMATVAGRTLLEWCVRRLAASSVPVLVATTTAPADDVIVGEAARVGADVFRGPERDVLERFVRAADSVRCRYVVRATADNPLVDSQAPGRVLAAMMVTGADYVCERGLPCGAAVEAVSREALHRAAQLATLPDDREHVTTFIKRTPALFRICEIAAPRALTAGDLRLTVDTPEDLRFVRTLLAAVGAAEVPSLRDIIVAARRAQTTVGAA